MFPPFILVVLFLQEIKGRMNNAEQWKNKETNISQDIFVSKKI